MCAPMLYCVSRAPQTADTSADRSFGIQSAKPSFQIGAQAGQRVPEPIGHDGFYLRTLTVHYVYVCRAHRLAKDGGGLVKLGDKRILQGIVVER